jgi:hypothetical protein
MSRPILLTWIALAVLVGFLGCSSVDDVALPDAAPESVQVRRGPAPSDDAGVESDAIAPADAAPCAPSGSCVYQSHAGAGYTYLDVCYSNGVLVQVNPGPLDISGNPTSIVVATGISCTMSHIRDAGDYTSQCVAGSCSP